MNRPYRVVITAGPRHTYTYQLTGSFEGTFHDNLIVHVLKLSKCLNHFYF